MGGIAGEVESSTAAVEKKTTQVPRVRGSGRKPVSGTDGRRPTSSMREDVENYGASPR